MSMAIRTGADTVVRAVPTRRQQLRGAIDNGLLRPGPDDSYADGDDSTWMSVDWPSMTRRVTVEGREVNVVDTGGDDRPAMVFVHGLSGSWQNWLLNIPAFMDSHRVIAPDLPGFGESPMPREEISIQGYARILDGRLRGRRAGALVLDPGGAPGARERRRAVDRGGPARAAAGRGARLGRDGDVAGRARPLRDHAPADAPHRAAADRALPGAALAGAHLRAHPWRRHARLHPRAGGADLLRLPRPSLADRDPDAGRLGPQRHARPARRCARVREPDRRQRAARDVRGHRP